MSQKPSGNTPGSTVVQRVGKGGFFVSGHVVMVSDGLFQGGKEGWRPQMQCGIEEGAGGAEGCKRVQQGVWKDV